MTSASIAQVASATAALCGAAGVTYYAVNVAKVFGGARRGEGDANGRARAIEGGRGATPLIQLNPTNGRQTDERANGRARARAEGRSTRARGRGWGLTMGARAREQAIRCRRR